MNLAPLRTPIPQLHYLICVPTLDRHSFKTHKCGILSLTSDKDSSKEGYQQFWHPSWDAPHLQVSRGATVPGSFFWQLRLWFCIIPALTRHGSSSLTLLSPWTGFLWPLQKYFLEVFELTSEFWVLFSSSSQRTAGIHLPWLGREVTSGSPGGWWPRSSPSPSSCWCFKF